MKWIEYTVVGIPLLIAACGLVGFVWRAWALKLRGPASNYGLQAGLLSLGLWSALLGAAIYDTDRRQTDRLSELSSQLATEQHLDSRVLDAAGEPDIQDEFRAQLSHSSPFQGQNVQVTRATFAPLPLPGGEPIRDILVSDVFGSYGLHLSQIVGYPPATDMSASHQRRQMQRYFFRFLTWTRWQTTSDVKKRLSVFYVPFARTYDGWTVLHPTKVRSATFIFRRGEWGQISAHPQASALMVVSKADIVEAIVNDHHRVVESGIAWLEGELEKPGPRRAPCVIFCQTRAQDGLQPMTLDELDRRRSELVNKWTLESDGTVLRTTPELQELNRLVDELLKDRAATNGEQRW